MAEWRACARAFGSTTSLPVLTFWKAVGRDQCKKSLATYSKHEGSGGVYLVADW